jgi:hypothetical protein
MMKNIGQITFVGTLMIFSGVIAWRIVPSLDVLYGVCYTYVGSAQVTCKGGLTLIEANAELELHNRMHPKLKPAWVQGMYKGSDVRLPDGYVVAEKEGK